MLTHADPTYYANKTVLLGGSATKYQQLPQQQTPKRTHVAETMRHNENNKCVHCR
jgi:hypothetical protein